MAKQLKQLDRHIESVLASMDVLDCFLIKPKLIIKDFVDLTGMTRNRVSRILGTLIHKGYVMESVENGMYTTGPKLMALGNVFKENQNLVVVVKKVLKEIALKTGESASFYVREGKERVVLARVDGTNAIRFSVAEGQRMDLHAGAAGKILLAYATESERNIILTSVQLPELTSNTITNPSTLLKELQRIQVNGYAVSKGERNPDAFSLAAPVFERDDQLIGAIAIAGPISRFNSETKDIYLKELMGSAQLLSELFNKGSNV